MSNIVTATKKLEKQLRSDGYKGTHKALRILKSLRIALESSGYSFSDEHAGDRKKNSKD